MDRRIESSLKKKYMNKLFVNGVGQDPVRVLGIESYVGASDVAKDSAFVSYLNISKGTREKAPFEDFMLNYRLMKKTDKKAAVESVVTRKRSLLEELDIINDFLKWQK